jgi:hypothetical protein
MQVSDIAQAVIDRFANGAKIKYTGGKQRWPGDVPDAFLSNRGMEEMGVELKHRTSREAVLNFINILSND